MNYEIMTLAIVINMSYLPCSGEKLLQFGNLILDFRSEIVYDHRYRITKSYLMAAKRYVTMNFSVHFLSLLREKCAATMACCDSPAHFYKMIYEIAYLL